MQRGMQGHEATVADKNARQAALNIVERYGPAALGRIREGRLIGGDGGVGGQLKGPGKVVGELE